MAAARSSRASRPASASTATRFFATPAMTKPRLASCAPPARWREAAGHAELPIALLPRVGKQLQARADADAMWRELRAGLDRFRRRRHADSGMAARRQRDGRNPGARGRWRAPDTDRADPAQAGKAVRPVRR